MGLLDSIFNMDDPQSMGLLNASSQILMGAGQTRQPFGLGQALGTGIQGYMQGNQAVRARQQQEAEQAQQMQARAMQIEAAKREQMQQQAAMQEQQRLREFYSKQGAQPQQAGAQPAQGGMQAPQQASSGDSLYESMMQEAKGLQAAGFIAQAQAKMKEALSVRPKFATEARTVMGPDGKPMLIQMADDGTARPIQGGFGAAEKLHFADSGQSIDGIDQFTGQIKSRLGKKQTLESIASNNVTMRGQNMTDERARDFNATASDANNVKREEARAVKDMTKASQVASFDTMLGTLSRLSEHPGLTKSVGINSAFPTMPGSESANFQAELETFKSQAFIPMVSQLKGMGALSDAEGKKLTAAVGALDPKMGEKAFRDSIGRVVMDMQGARERVSGGAANGGASGDWGAKDRQPAAAKKTVTVSDIAETARKSGRSTAEVTAALRAKGYLIGGQ